MMNAVENAVVEVVHGAEFVRHADLLGSTVGQANTYLRHVLNIRASAAARLNGRSVRDDEVLMPGNILEFLDGPGQKGIDELLTVQEFLEVTGLLPWEYECLLAQEMPVYERPGGAKMTLEEIRNWLHNQSGVFMAAARTAVARTRLRIDEEQGAAILDGRPYHLTEAQAMIIQVMLDNLGNRVSSTQMVEARPLLHRVRAGRCIKTLPPAIRSLIDSDTKGHRLRLE
jgi:hypothetical protein